MCTQQLQDGGGETLPHSYTGKGQTLPVSPLRSWFWNIYFNPRLGSVFFSCNETMGHWNHPTDDTILFSLFEKLNDLILRTRNGLSIGENLLAIHLPANHPSPNLPNRVSQHLFRGHLLATLQTSWDVNQPVSMVTPSWAREVSQMAATSQYHLMQNEAATSQNKQTQIYTF